MIMITHTKKIQKCPGQMNTLHAIFQCIENNTTVKEIPTHFFVSELDVV